MHGDVYRLSHLPLMVFVFDNKLVIASEIAMAQAAEVWWAVLRMQSQSYCVHVADRILTLIVSEMSENDGHRHWLLHQCHQC